MGKVVGGFMVPHPPLMFQVPDAPNETVRRRMRDAYGRCAEQLAALEATSVIIVGADHYINFGTGCLPQYLIGIGDVDGPLDVMPGLPRKVMQTSQVLASFIADHGRCSGFDWAVARALTVDHAIAIPDRLVVDPVRAGGREIGTVPIYIAAGVDPYISIKRAIQLGGAIKVAVEEFPEDERVVLIGSGGISHWVGQPEMGRVNEAFDREIMAYACTGDLTAMLSLSDNYIMANGGIGGMEIRQWAVVMGAMPGVGGAVIDYEPVSEWVTGLGFVQLSV